MFRWENPEKRRYYQVSLQKDLLGDWVLSKAWGGIGQKFGRMVHMPCRSLQEAEAMVERIARIRKNRGYILNVRLEFCLANDQK